MSTVTGIKIRSQLVLLHFCLALTVLAQPSSIQVDSKRNSSGDFALATREYHPPLLLDRSDFPGVLRAAYDLQLDIERVTNRKPELLYHTPAEKEIVIIGSIGKNKMLDQLIQNKKIDVSEVTGKWETFLIQTLENPFPNIERALVIAGSDKRGTIFGIYELAKQIGVSPWYWWADVPPKKSNELYIKSERYVQGEPPVKYRGIFINDEEPALGRWAVANYGGFSSEFYKKVFELMLRMKANYLWPAMWWASFNENDTLNAKLADEYGIVMGTTHHEPMNRAHADWRKHGKGAWNYETNETELKHFWREGIERMGNRETIISLGMRGDGDMAMSRETNIALLERIVKDQREILAEVTKRDVTETPQLWALYKEVQDYYDQGMRVPDDVTLLLCDDNWGNLRKLPNLNDKPRPTGSSGRARKGGYGIYYHFDYVGGPRNYKWLNTNPLPRIWEQMHLAYRYGANEIWIVNVGDIKPMELPIEFFLDYAWNPEAWPHDKLDEYTQQWAAQQFGPTYAADIADILAKYTKYNGRRKPELLSPDVYSLHHYREAETIVDEYNVLAEKAERIYKEIPEEYKDAYYQLVLHPVSACANLNELWVTVAKNRLYAKQGRALTNDLAVHGRKLFEKDSALSHYYNKVMANGKWNHMMDQTHISYTYWQQPQKDIIPDVNLIDLPDKAEMGVAIEGSEDWYEAGKNIDLQLPEFDNYHQESYYIDIFNRGKIPFQYTASSKSKWLQFSNSSGTVDKEQRIWISVDWKDTKPGRHTLPITIKDNINNTFTVWTTVHCYKKSKRPQGFIENNGYISINAENSSRAHNTETITWKILPDHGKTSSAVTTFPVTAEPQVLGRGPYLEYDFHLMDDREVNVQAYFSPTLNFHGTSLRYGISIDDEKLQVIELHEGMNNKVWEKWVADNIIIKTSAHGKLRAGNHTLNIWMVDSGVVLQKLVLDMGGVKASYLGPPESKRLVK
jgi:hypothetical protein